MRDTARDNHKNKRNVWQKNEEEKIRKWRFAENLKRITRNNTNVASNCKTNVTAICDIACEVPRSSFRNSIA